MGLEYEHAKKTFNFILNILSNTKPDKILKFDQDVQKDIVLKKMERLERIGGGSFGNVYSVKDKNGYIMALKSIRLYSGIEFLTEATIMKSLSHPHINGSKSVRVTEDHLYIVQDLAKSDLFDFIMENEIDEDLLDQWIYQLLNAVFCMHKEGFIHCDIKPGVTYLSSVIG